jgi:hypothetical protein
MYVIYEFIVNSQGLIFNNKVDRAGRASSNLMKGLHNGGNSALSPSI